MHFQTFHKNSNDFEGTLHISNDDLRYSSHHIPLNYIWIYPIAHSISASCTTNQISYFSFPLLPATQFYCYSVIYFLLEANIK